MKTDAVCIDCDNKKETDINFVWWIILKIRGKKEKLFSCDKCNNE